MVTSGGHPTDPKDLSEDAIGQIMAHFCTRDLSNNTAEGDLGWAAALSLGFHIPT